MQTSQQIAHRIHRQGPGWVFSPTDFLDLGSPQTVGMTLLRLTKHGTIRRLGRGLYEAPKTHLKLGLLHARPEAILAAISRREGTDFCAHEAYAANRLGLTEQMPTRVRYLTPGRSRTIKVGRTSIELRHRAPRKIAALHRLSAMVFAALRGIGQSHLSPRQVAPLRQLLQRRDRARLLRDLRFAPAWMHPFLRLIANPGKPRKPLRPRAG